MEGSVRLREYLARDLLKVAQVRAGEAFRADWLEAAQGLRHARADRTTSVHTMGGFSMRAVAAERARRALAALGGEGSMEAHAVLGIVVSDLAAAEVARLQGWSPRTAMDALRAGLDKLVDVYRLDRPVAVDAAAMGLDLAVS